MPLLPNMWNPVTKGPGRWKIAESLLGEAQPDDAPMLTFTVDAMGEVTVTGLLEQIGPSGGELFSRAAFDISLEIVEVNGSDYVPRFSKATIVNYNPSGGRKNKAKLKVDRQLHLVNTHPFT